MSDSRYLLLRQVIIFNYLFEEKTKQRFFYSVRSYRIYKDKNTPQRLKIFFPEVSLSRKASKEAEALKKMESIVFVKNYYEGEAPEENEEEEELARPQQSLSAIEESIKETTDIYDEDKKVPSIDGHKSMIVTFEGEEEDNDENLTGFFDDTNFEDDKDMLESEIKVEEEEKEEENVREENVKEEEEEEKVEEG